FLAKKVGKQLASHLAKKQLE
uniref:Short cationic peptide-4a n=1 Tax=Cupiennius salei TaxID=6928 RepID=TXS4A_CUPSA|nr:RecName: Full=Short cationic peptide-4a; Short=SCP-4a; AltName: Full=Short cationic peptide-4c; Short=SCP-4c; AltName: Full=Truncated variant of Cupiennin 4 family [Cupiennius salei]